MNINPKATVILCFGDSNTWGRNPVDTSRFDSSQRWTGVLQKRLGTEDYYVIEEGLGGRTTDIDNPKQEGRNGFLYFKPCVESHNPDVVVLMLGTNDLKDVFNRNAFEISKALEKYCKHLQDLEKSPTLILVSPTGVDMNAPEFYKYADKFTEKSLAKASELTSLIRDLTVKFNCIYLDANDFAVLGEEGLHWTAESHEKFGKELAEKIRGIR